MAYTDQQMSKGRVVALGVVIVIHIMLGWAFSAGLAPKFVKTILEPMKVSDIKEAPPPEDEPPPPPEELVEIPPYVPPPDLPIELPPPPTPVQTITTQQAVKQTEAPRVVQPAPPVAKPAVKRVAAKPSRRNTIGEDDYPSASLRAEEEGITTVRYVVGTNGRVEQCTVVKSSGHPRLDERTCDLIQRRFRFDPATADGAPVEETKTQAVRWQITGR